MLDMCVDLMGPLSLGESILVVVDYCSHYYEVAVLKFTTAPKIISSLDEIFSRHGLPETLTSDNSPQFVSAEFGEYPESRYQTPSNNSKVATGKWRGGTTKLINFKEDPNCTS